METIKIAKNFLIGFFMCAFLTYLIGCFCMADFNLAKWDATSRGVIGWFGAMFSIIGGGVFYQAIASEPIKPKSL